MTERIAVVTGANKGIGFEIARKLATAGYRTVMAARSVERGVAAAREVGGEAAGVEFRQLDLCDSESIRAFVSGLESDYGRCDCLVNNAGFAFKGADPTPHAQQARPTFAPNYFGTMELTLQMLPLLRKGTSPRVVNVASMAGHLRIMPSQDRASRLVAPDLTLEEVDAMAREFVNAVEAGVEAENRWPKSNYGCSKLMLIAATRVLARQEGASMMINACCPGYVATDMSSHKGHKTPEEGARTPSMLALMPDCGPTGKFFSDEVEVEW